MQLHLIWNGGNLPNDNRIFKSEYGYDQKRWELARDAAKAVLECTKEDGSLRYKLYETYTKDDFRDVDGKTDTNNKKVQQRLWQMMYDMNAIQDEWVWFVTRDKDTGWSGDVLPPSQGGHARQRPLQEQVDEYEYIAPDGYGYPIYCNHAEKMDTMMAILMRAFNVILVCIVIFVIMVPGMEVTS